MDFWYTMYGDNGLGILNVYTNITNTTSLMWTQNGNKGKEWLNGRLTIHSAQAFRIIFETVRGTTFESSIAIDDIDFNDKSCDIYPQDANPINVVTIPMQLTTRSARPPSQYDCNFEVNFCMWTAAKENTFNWTRVQGILGDVIAGPIESDHTYAVPYGWYLFVDTRNKNPNDIARIETNLFNGVPRCMEFYYYFFATAKYKFNIYIKLNDQLSYPIWSRENSNADFWRFGRITVTSGISDYRVVLEMTGIQFGSPSEKFGLDDIYFTNGACMDSSDVNGVCTFSNGDMCGYTVNSTGNNNFKWTVYTPTLRILDEIEPRVGPLPINDHTTEGIGSGYLYVQSSGFKFNDSTSLFSKQYPALDTSDPIRSSRCFEFYFFIQDTDSIGLNVRTATTSSVRNLIWSRNYEHSKYWWKAEINIKLITNYSVLIEAVIGNNPNNGLAALDDISLRNGACSR